MELGGTYQSFIYKLGDCCGNVRIVCPCCCCVNYPYQQIDQSFVGMSFIYVRNLWEVRPIREDNGLRTTILQPLHRPHSRIEDNIEALRSPQNLLRRIKHWPFRPGTDFCHFKIDLWSVYFAGFVGKKGWGDLGVGQVCCQAGAWVGIEITNILIKDIVLNQELQDILSAVAKEKRLAGKLWLIFRVQNS